LDIVVWPCNGDVGCAGADIVSMKPRRTTHGATACSIPMVTVRFVNLASPLSAFPWASWRTPKCQ
jgi:hypothetical protein